MVNTYATSADLTARLSSAYTTPADASTLLTKASELIDFATVGNAQKVWDGTNATLKAELTLATCDQVEFWLEVGEEHDVVGLHGSLQGGRVQVQKLPPYLGPRATRTLLRAGILTSAVRAF